MRSEKKNFSFRSSVLMRFVTTRHFLYSPMIKNEELKKGVGDK